ncbi:hypothetical protein AURDEDRAFT_177031 [Auricularia subglabra TFB-10046 SS5]|uniref:F-box domain-containing protein n=1 Tax=Auricularia subglabra (strain TFB-10046 / SS5) TaxID=717982 RepID=J0CU82_AURST|nr:hypothetical protein AURDEDRAFT_177031 [Auricularia subglabra TFB-10046 SS5]
MVSTERIVWEILPPVLVYLAFPELQRLARTCRHMKAVVAHSLPRLYDIDVFLAQFFGDLSAEFRFLQACTGLLISGSQALQFLDRTRYGSCDIDLYVGALAALVVIDWLLYRGFVLLSPRSSPFRRRTGTLPNLISHARIRGNRYFLRPGHSLFQFISPCGRWKVDLIVSTHSPFSAVCDFHSTIVLNFISAFCAISLFPRGTFVHRLFMSIRAERGARIDRVREKYMDRGFDPPSKKPAAAAVSFFPGPRYVRDSRACWLLPLPPVAPGPFAFWHTRPYDLCMFRSEKFRQGLSYWYRMGCSLLTRGENGKILFVEFSYDGRHDYCVPIELAACPVVFDCTYLSTIHRGHMDDV